MIVFTQHEMTLLEMCRKAFNRERKDGGRSVKCNGSHPTIKNLVRNGMVEVRTVVDQERMRITEAGLEYLKTLEKSETKE